MNYNKESCYYYNEVTINKRKTVLLDVAIVLTMDSKTLEDEKHQTNYRKSAFKQVNHTIQQGF